MKNGRASHWQISLGQGATGSSTHFSANVSSILDQFRPFSSTIQNPFFFNFKSLHSLLTKNCANQHATDSVAKCFTTCFCKLGQLTNYLKII